MSKLVSYDSGDDSANDGGSAGKDSSSTHETVKQKSLTKEKQLSSEWDSFNQMISDKNNEECKPVVKPEEAACLVMYPSYNASIIEFSKIKYDNPRDVKSSSDDVAANKEVHSRRFTESRQSPDDTKSVGMYNPLDNSSEDEKSEGEKSEDEKSEDEKSEGGKSEDEKNEDEKSKNNIKASKPKEIELLKEKANTKKDKDSKSLKLSHERKRVPRRSTSDDSSDESVNDRKRKRSRSHSVSKKRKRSKVRERSKEKDSRHRGSRRHRSRSRSSSRNRRRHHTSKSHRERRSRSRSRRRDRRRHERRRTRSRSRQPRGPALATSLSKSAPVPSKSNPKNFKEQLKAMFIQAQSQSTEEIEKEIELDETRLLTANEKKSALPLNSKNPLAAMVAGGSKATPQQALAQTMAAMHAKVQEITGVAVPKYYNPAAVNPIKYAEQLKKRKLLWSKNKEADKEKEVDAKSQVQWSSTSFSSDQDGKMAAKFRKLMGIKEDERLAAISNDPDLSKMTEEQRKKQEELFLQLDREYEFARMSTHTCRGVGLGFTSHNVLDSQ